MENIIAKIREKLEFYSNPFIAKDVLSKILEKFAPNYSIPNLCNKGLITPIKRGKWYINNKTRKFINPFVVGDLFMGDDLYMFGGIGIYNKYGLTEQIAEWQTIYNTKFSGQKIIGGAKFIFVRQRESFFYDIREEKFEDHKYNVMSIERAFIELLKEKKTFKEIPYGINKKKLLTLAMKNTSENLRNKIEQLCISLK